MRGRAGLASALGAAAVLGWLALRSLAPEAAEPVPRTGGAESDGRGWIERTEDRSAAEASERTHAGEGLALPAAEVPGAGERRDPNAGALQVVSDEDGAPVDGAIVSWCVPDRAWGRTRPLARDVAAIELAGGRWVSDGEGLVEGLEPPPGAARERSVLWVTRAGFTGAGFELAAGERPPARVALAPGGALSVRVVDAEGRPVPGARVEHLPGRHPPRELAGESEFERVWSAFARSATAGGDGRVELGAIPGEQWLRALGPDGTRSAAWAGEAPADVELRLAATFEVTAKVELAPGVEGPVDVLVRVAALRGTVSTPLVEAPARAPGTVGPIPVPAIAADQLLLRVEGAPLIPREELRAMPAAGASLSFDLVLEAGIEIPVRVVDERQEPVARADVSVWWFLDGRWVRATGRTGEDGECVVPGARPGSIWVRAAAEGYVDTTPPVEWQYHKRPDEPIEVVLSRSGIVRGTVLDGGKPAKTFEVVLWNVEETAKANAKVDRSTDGTFVIENAPLGPVRAMARAPDRGRSEVLDLVVEPGADTSVTLELAPLGRGRGRVVDAVSGLPIEGAAVQLYLVEAGSYHETAGGVHLSDAGGEFELTELLPGVNHFQLWADGYGRRVGSARHDPGDPGGESDLGTWPLAPTAPLTVLVHDRSGRPVPGTWVSGSGPTQLPMRRTDGDGRVRYENVQSGSYALSVVLEGEEISIDRSVFLRSGEPWNIVLEADPSEDEVLRVRVLPPAGGELPTPLLVQAVEPYGEVGRAYRMCEVREDGTALLLGPFSGEVTLELYHNVAVGGGLLAARRVDPTEWRGREVVMRPLGGQTVLRVVDGDGRPLENAFVELWTRTGAPGWTFPFSVDANGEARLPVLDLGEFLADVRHERIGAVQGLRVGELRDGAVCTLVVEPDATLELVLLDGHTPVPQIMPALQRPGAPGLSLYAPASDVEGRISVGPLSSGEWVIDIVDIGVWPTRPQVRVDPGANVLELQVRRLGAVDVLVRTRGSVPVAGARVELTSLEFATPVSRWIALGRVAPPAGGAATDENGRLTFSGLPNGRYAYRVEARGKVVEGELVVPAAARAAVPITLP